MKICLKPLLTAGLIFACASHVTWSEEFYRWHDKNGVAHYGAMPPRGGVNSTKIRVYGTKAPKSSKATIAQNGNNEAAAATAQQASDQRKLKQAQEADCQAERKRISTLKANQPIRIKQENGKLKYLTKEEIASEIQQSQTFIDDACS